MGRPLTMSQEHLAEHRKSQGDGERFVAHLPWPLIRFEERHRSYQNRKGERVDAEDHRTYRFFSGIETVRHTNDRSGFSWSDIQYEQPYWSSLMMLGLYSGLAPVTSARMPRDLYMVPVDDFPGEDVDPLAWAVNPPSSPAQRRAAKMDNKRGMRPQLMFWSSALVEEPNDDGVVTYLAIVQMRKSQAVKLADKWESFVRMARVKGIEADLSGIPVNVWENRGGSAKDYDLDLYRADGDRIDLQKEYEAPDHELLAQSMRMELDRFLVESGTPIKDFPNKGDHEEDGWSTDMPACLKIGGPAVNGSKQSPGGLDEFAGNDYTKMSSRDMIELLQSKGIEVPTKASRERLLAMLEDAEGKTTA